MGESIQQPEIAVICWVVYSLLDGVTDAVFYYNHPVRAHRTPNEHTFYWWRRIVVACGLFAFNPILIAFSALVFPFLHDGSQYFTANRLTKGAVYKNGFFSEPSENSTARKDFTLVERCLTFFVGIIVLVLWMRVNQGCGK